MRNKCYQRVIRDKKMEEEVALELNSWWKNYEFNSKNAKIKIIPNSDAKYLILQYEWLGTMPSAPILSVGLFFNNVLSAVEVFTDIKGGGSKFELYGQKAICLARGCCAYWCPKWCSSYLISKALKIVEDYFNGEPMYVMAYSDWEAGEIGTVYQASNWIYTGEINSPKWVSPEGRKYDHNHHRNLSRKLDIDFKTNKKLNPVIVEKTKQDLISKGWTRVNIVRGRYVTVIGYKGKKKQELIKILQHYLLPYPKDHKPK